MSSRPSGRRNTGTRARRAHYRPGVEAVERRELLATFSVTNNTSAGTGSLRQAILDANASPGLDTINFSITGSTTITLDQANGPLPTVSDPVIIDGTTQPGYAGSPLIEIVGTNVSGDGLRITGGGTTVRALAINRFTGAGIRLDSQGNNLIEGSHIGIDRAGGTALGNGAQGIFIASSGNTLGGTTANSRNVVSGNTSDGILLFGSNAASNLIRNTNIGTNRTGNQAVPNGGSGVLISGASSNIIGGTSAQTRNLISGNSMSGVVLLLDTATNNIIQGNYIGTDVAGTANIGNRNHGVLIDGGSNNSVGGANANTGNTIAFNGGTTTTFNGVTVLEGTRNAILSNNIFDNAGLGIDLGGNGVTPNDPTESDTGPNNLQNFPQIFSASTVQGTTTVQGTLQSEGGSPYVIQFFESTTADNSQFGEGQRFVGSTTVTTDANGFAAFNVTLPTSVLVGNVVSATATSADGNTSEFSQVRSVAAGSFRIVDLGVEATASPDPVDAGQPLTYTAIVQNNGFATADNAVLTTTLPSSVILEDISTSQGTISQVGNVITVNIGQLVIGQTAQITLEVTPTLAGILSMRFAVRGGINDPFPTNDTAVVDTQVMLDPSTSVLSFENAGYSVTESGNAAIIAVRRSNSLEGTVSVNYATANGTAISGQNYIQVSGTLTFTDNEQVKTFTVPILDNSVLDPNRSVNLILGSPTNGAILGSLNRSVLTIFDDDPPTPPTQKLEFGQMDFSAEESAGFATVTVSRTGSTVGTVSINYATSDDTARAGIDYTAVSGTLVFSNGEATKSFQVPINDNLVMDGSRSFIVTLSGGVGATLGDRSSAQVTIIDDETPLPPPAGSFQFSMSGYQAVENGGQALITVTRLGGAGAASVDYFTTTTGTAQPGQRFVAIPRTTLQFAADEFTKTFTVSLINTSGYEGTQTVGLALEASGNAGVGTPSTAVLSILDDEVPPPSVLQFSQGAYTVSEDGGSAQITVTRTGGIDREVTVLVATGGGNAAPTQDYTPVNTTLTFVAGQTSATFEVPVLDNTLIDGDRVLNLTLSAPGEGALLGSPAVASLVIQNDDLDVVPPRVVNVMLDSVPGGDINTIAVGFSEAVDPATASSLSNYSVVALGPDGVAGTPDDRILPIGGITMHPSNRVAFISLASGLPLNEFAQIAVSGIAGGITDTSGVLLDGDANGIAGGYFFSIFGRGTSLTYADADGDLVTLGIRNGGLLELSRDFSGEGKVLRLINPTPNRSVLFGSVRRRGAGVTSLERIEGLDPFGRVRSSLTTPPFFVQTMMDTNGSPVSVLSPPTRRTPFGRFQGVLNRFGGRA